MRPSTLLDYEERVDSVVRLLLATLDGPLDTPLLARRASYSRFHFTRLFKDLMGETPGRFRRRLLLERSAHLLVETRRSITEIALDSGYLALEAYTRAFHKAFGESPSAYRLTDRTDYRLPASSGVHFHACADRSRGLVTKGDTDMDLLDRLIDHDAWIMRRLLECARPLADETLDRVSSPGHKSLRQLLCREVWHKEMWVAAMTGQRFDENTDESVPGMLSRLDNISPQFAEIARRVRDRSQWDETFTDAICEPVETFTFGGAIAHIVTNAAHRRAVIIDTLKCVGVDRVPGSDPLDWERNILPAALTPA